MLGRLRPSLVPGVYGLVSIIGTGFYLSSKPTPPLCRVAGSGIACIAASVKQRAVGKERCLLDRGF
jgi:hypothetical protein